MVERIGASLRHLSDAAAARIEQMNHNSILRKKVNPMNNRIAADAAAWALSKVGCPYSQEKRNQDGVFDCSSLVARAYAAQGKRWRYGGSVPRSNQEVYDDDFDCSGRRSIRRLEGSSAARTCSNARISPAIFSSFARISARAVRIESPMWRWSRTQKTSSTPEERHTACV